jgi:hypothetical protein
MRGWMLLMACGWLAPTLGKADPPPVPAASDTCLKIDNRVLGPRTSGRPMPLLRGDETHGFHTACMVSWRTLSPGNAPLSITDCFRGSLLQIANDSACGGGTGPLWVSSRWVMTSAELAKPTSHAATCHQLETGAWAGTRAYEFDCIPQKKEIGVAAGTAAAKQAQGATAAADKTPARRSSTSVPAPASPASSADAQTQR